MFLLYTRYINNFSFCWIELHAYNYILDDVTIVGIDSTALIMVADKQLSCIRNLKKYF